MNCTVPLAWNELLGYFTRTSFGWFASVNGFNNGIASVAPDLINMQHWCTIGHSFLAANTHSCMSRPSQHAKGAKALLSIAECMTTHENDLPTTGLSVALLAWRQVMTGYVRACMRGIYLHKSSDGQMQKKYQAQWHC